MIGQSKLASFIEALVNVAVGFTVATLANLGAFWVLKIPASFGQTTAVAALLTVISIVRSYTLRRFFNWLHISLHQGDVKWIQSTALNLNRLRDILPRKK